MTQLSSSYASFPPLGTRLEQVECFNEDTRAQHWRSELVVLKLGISGPWWDIQECNHHHWTRTTAEKCLKKRGRNGV